MTDDEANWSLVRAWRQMLRLPLHLHLWLGWLTVSTLLVPLFLLGNGFFAAMMVCQALNLAFGTVLLLRFGLVRLLGLSHLLFWTPILFKFRWNYEALKDPALLAFCRAMILTICISLALDAQDLRDWFRGNTAPVGT